MKCVNRKTISRNMAAPVGNSSGCWSVPEVYKHHEQRKVCISRPKYREGRKSKAVKVSNCYYLLYISKKNTACLHLCDTIRIVYNVIYNVLTMILQLFPFAYHILQCLIFFDFFFCLSGCTSFRCLNCVASTEFSLV